MALLSEYVKASECAIFRVAVDGRNSAHMAAELVIKEGAYEHVGFRPHRCPKHGRLQFELLHEKLGLKTGG